MTCDGQQISSNGFAACVIIMYKKILGVLIFFLCEVFGDEYLDDVQSSTTRLYEGLPDNSIVLPDRMNPKKLPTISHYSWNKQNVERNSSSTVTPEMENLEDSRRCSCAAGICKCCSLLLNRFQQKACLKIVYHPNNFTFDVSMIWNDIVYYESSLSGRNPKPICIHPPRLNNLKVCAKFYNVFFPGRNFHFCLSMTGRWRSFELFYVDFDCLRVGANGIATMRPQDNGGLVTPNPQGLVHAVVDSGDGIPDYDENGVKTYFNTHMKKNVSASAASDVNQQDGQMMMKKISQV